MLAVINFFTSQLQPDSQNQPNSALNENSGREKTLGMRYLAVWCFARVSHSVKLAAINLPYKGQVYVSGHYSFRAERGCRDVE